jgi:hypothetical protein
MIQSENDGSHYVELLLLFVIIQDPDWERPSALTIGHTHNEGLSTNITHPSEERIKSAYP